MTFETSEALSGNICGLSQAGVSEPPIVGQAQLQDVCWRLIDPMIEQMSCYAGLADREALGTEIRAAIIKLRAQALESGWPTARYQPNSDRIIDFLRGNWKPWIRTGQLTRPILKKIDPAAYTALNNWLKKNGRLPEDVHIPTKSEILAQGETLELTALQRSARQFHAADARRRRRAKKTSTNK